MLIFLSHLTSLRYDRIRLLQLGLILLNLEVSRGNNLHSLISNFTIYLLFQTSIYHLFESSYYLLSTACSLEPTSPCHLFAVLPTASSYSRSRNSNSTTQTKPRLRNHGSAKQYALTHLFSSESNCRAAEFQTQAQQLEYSRLNR